MVGSVNSFAELRFVELICGPPTFAYTASIFYIFHLAELGKTIFISQANCVISLVFLLHFYRLSLPERRHWSLRQIHPPPPTYPPSEGESIQKRHSKRKG
jgi:hypothetical protein